MSQGALGRMLVDTATPFDSASIWLEFISENITENQEILNSAGIRGTRSHASERSRTGPTRISGTIVFEMTKAALDILLPSALGAAESTNVFDVAETLGELQFLIDKRNAIYLIANAQIGVMRIVAEQSQIVRVECDIEAESITGAQSWPGTPPALDTGKPYMFSDLGDVTLVGSARKPASMTITVDNQLDADTFLNSLTRTDTIFATDRIVTAEFSMLASTANADLRSAAIGGAAVSIVLTNAEEASGVVTIALGRWKPQNAIPTVDGKGTKMLTVTGQSRALWYPSHASYVPDIKITNAHA